MSYLKIYITAWSEAAWLPSDSAILHSLTDYGPVVDDKMRNTLVLCLIMLIGIAINIIRRKPKDE